MKRRRSNEKEVTPIAEFPAVYDITVTYRNGNEKKFNSVRIHKIGRVWTVTPTSHAHPPFQLQKDTWRSIDIQLTNDSETLH